MSRVFVECFFFRNKTPLRAEKSATFHQAEPLVGSQTSNRCSLEASQDDPFDCPFPRRRGTLNPKQLIFFRT